MLSQLTPGAVITLHVAPTGYGLEPGRSRCSGRCPEKLSEAVISTLLLSLLGNVQFYWRYHDYVPRIEKVMGWRGKKAMRVALGIRCGYDAAIAVGSKSCDKYTYLPNSSLGAEAGQMLAPLEMRPLCSIV
jgi:hypothetical protein